MKIVDIRATTITVPLEAPLRHSNGAHWGRFVRTIVEVETDDGLIGLGEMGGGGESAELAFRGLIPYLNGHDPFDLEALRLKIANPTASLYNNRTQILAALEFACLDIIGKKLDQPVYNLLGGKLRDEVEFATYLFYRYADPATGKKVGRAGIPDLVEFFRPFTRWIVFTHVGSWFYKDVPAAVRKIEALGDGVRVEAAYDGMVIEI